MKRSDIIRLQKETRETFTHEFFEDSAKCWAQNKKKLENGTYKYSCDYVYKSGKRCGKSCEHTHIPVTK
jgi:galactose-1-phosphate uridylyltransferase